MSVIDCLSLHMALEWTENKESLIRFIQCELKLAAGFPVSLNKKVIEDKQHRKKRLTYKALCDHWFWRNSSSSVIGFQS